MTVPALNSGSRNDESIYKLRVLAKRLEPVIDAVNASLVNHKRVEKLCFIRRSMVSCSKNEKQKRKRKITYEERCAIINAWLNCKDDGFDKHMSELISQKRKEMPNYDEDREDLILDFKRNGFSSLKGVKGWVEKEMEEELPQKMAE
ncbi:hypothetical protein C5167_015497 [Papaver somniferum]|uniref:Uncharacterized protein n=1 Tax=Papaver somniferum TaxID=3469 RepID=A0A4Y7J765_PAPSO|nr:hypothetical protein C5167_015497 [Papaver somniferum]